MKKSTNVLVVLLVVAVAVLGLLFNRSKTATVQIQTIKVGYLPLTDHLPLMVAEGEKMFTGVNVEAVKFTDWPSLVEALKSGKIDGAHMINTLTMKAIADGYDGKIVALSHRGDIALVTKAGVADVSELRGKTIAVPSHFSPHYMMLYNYLSESGIDPKVDVKILDVAPPDFISTMAAGRVDGFIGSEPFPTIAESKKVGEKFKLWNEMQIPGTNGLDCVVVFRGDLIKSSPEAVQSYVSAIVHAGNEIETNPDTAAKTASPLLLNLDPKVIVRAIDVPKNMSSYSDLTPKMAEFTAFQNYMVKIGLIKQGIDLESAIDDHFARTAYGE